MRNIGLSTFFTRQPPVVDQDSVGQSQNGETKKTAKAAPVAGGAPRLDGVRQQDRGCHGRQAAGRAAGLLNAERSKVVTVLATLHDEVHAEVPPHLAKANLQDHVNDRVRKLLEQTPPIDDTTAGAEHEARPEAQHLADERRHDLANKQELSTARQRRDDRAQPAS